MSEIESALQSAQELVAARSLETRTPEPNRLDAIVTRENLVTVVQELIRAHWGYLAAITGLDLLPVAPPKKGEIVSNDLEVLYHFCSGAAVLTLRVRVPREDASVPTICTVIPAASPFERELSEMFGIEVVGTPDPARLYLPDDWEMGAYPLRKDFAFQAVSEEDRSDDA